MLLGGGFGRKLPGQIEIIGQAVKLAMDSPWPVKVIWPREEEVAQGTYRPQTAIAMQGRAGRRWQDHRMAQRLCPEHKGFEAGHAAAL